MALYKGITFQNFTKNKTFILTDVEIVKKDIMNHIHTRFGERVMMGGFGSSIPDAPFSQMTDETVNFLTEDLRLVLQSDPRVEIRDLRAIRKDDHHILILVADLLYVELNLVDELAISLSFES